MDVQFDADAVIVLEEGGTAMVHKVRGRPGYPERVRRIDRLRPSEAAIH